MTTDASTDEEFLRQLLDESDVPSSDTLQDSLLELRAAGSVPAAPPSAELAAFLSPKVIPLRPRRRAAKGALIGVAVAAATGLGVTGVAAASPEFRSAADQTVQQVASFFNNDDGGSPVQQTTSVNPGQDDSEGTDADTGNERRTPAEDSDTGSAGSRSGEVGDAGKPLETGESGTGSAGTSGSGASPSGKHDGATRSEGVPSLDGRPNQDGVQPNLPVPELPGDKVLPKNLDDQPGEDKLPLPAEPKPPAVPQKTDPAAIPDVPVLPDSAVDGSR
ncbi:hypothetical protein [Arthrobacter crystallopoietes]|uniref:Anti-sigma-D factor RsdA to sigma factor binding region n=1 Tax=Crystallibacter crystallopoietes TaxID=37928 RepID=A0A1H1AF44_9MICC|nr:hypothetical protein [Arthrobacter crystallopoietes]AUI51551.1 hypothetical protein AC20117_12830 [Arthrobacter crystallopoietes]SDQ38292.1 hypothetical protein SAMN04489742_0898 [Arthrobacter crystallopoietes]